MGMEDCSLLQPVTRCSVHSAGVRLRLGDDCAGPGGGGILLPAWRLSFDCVPIGVSVPIPYHYHYHSSLTRTSSAPSDIQSAKVSPHIQVGERGFG
jgi:hypothetical protein